MESFNAYASLVNKTIVNINQFTDEQKFKAIQVLQSADFTTPIFTARQSGMTVMIRSPVYHKAVIVHIKKPFDKRWEDMPFSKPYAEVSRGLAGDDWATFSANLRAELKDGGIVHSSEPTVTEVLWERAFNQAVEKPSADASSEEKAMSFFHNTWKVWAWSCAMFRLFSEVFLAEMNGTTDEGMTLLLGHKAKVMYSHCDENTKMLNKFFGKNADVNTIVVDA
jgi:hypothetical protein